MATISSVPESSSLERVKGKPERNSPCESVSGVPEGNSPDNSISWECAKGVPKQQFPLQQVLQLWYITVDACFIYLRPAL